MIAARRRDPQLAGTNVATKIVANQAYRLHLPGTVDLADALGLSRLQLVARSTADGRAIGDLITKGGAQTLSELQALPPADRDHAVEIILAWLEAEKGFGIEADSEKSTAWRDRSQSYDFGLQAKVPGAAAIQLSARGYPGGRLDWQHFDFLKGPDVYPEGERMKIEVLASPLRFPGQPALRFWEIENGAVHFGDLAGGPGDLSCLILAAYVAVAGDDWFVVPARLPSGVVCRVSSVHIRDNFEDEPHRISASAQIDQKGGKDRVWRWFEPSGSAEAEPDGTPLLLLPPALMTSRHGDVLEEVRFCRYEMANLAWAIERKYQGAFCRPVTNEMPPPALPPVPAIAVTGPISLAPKFPAIGSRWYRCGFRNRAARSRFTAAPWPCPTAPKVRPRAAESCGRAKPLSLTRPRSPMVVSA